jgi:hypothetical protein
MGRAATQRAPRSKPAAKANKSPDQSGTGGNSAKKTTSASGIRVSLEAPHVAAAKPNALPTLAVHDRAVLLPRAVVPFSDAAVAKSLVFGALVYGHVRDASVQGAVSIAIAGGGSFQLGAAAVQPFWLQPNTLTADLEASLRAAIDAVAPVAPAGGAARTDGSQASRRERPAAVLRKPGATLAWPRRRTHGACLWCALCRPSLRPFRSGGDGAVPRQPHRPADVRRG